MYFLFLTFATILMTIFRHIKTAGALAGTFNLFRPVTCVITSTMHQIIFAVIAVLHCNHIITEIFIDTS